jgi:UDP-N-acetylmuramate--alanine ligase
MRLYFCGAGGVGIGPLAMIAIDCGWEVFGSDLNYSPMVKELEQKGVKINIGSQDGEYLKNLNAQAPIDYFIYSSALSDDHPELIAAQKLNIKTIKRAELINFIIQNKNLKMLAVAGTHGKTTTTAMIVWILTKLNAPVSYSIGSTITFGFSGAYQPDSQYFIYEADEYDKNFLNFKPALSLITNVDYDHPDIYPTVENYIAAFNQFRAQSERVIDPIDENNLVAGLKLNGLHNRKNASQAIKAIRIIYPELDLGQIIEAANSYPGTGRRMEKLAKNIYSDYAHTPEELTSTMQMVSEMFDNEKITVVYQPHQNKRQQEILDSGGYKDALSLASKIYWLPTYLTRENKEDAIRAKNLISSLNNSGVVEASEMNQDLIAKLKLDYDNCSVIIFFGAGDIDAWARDNLNQIIQ